MWSVTKESGRIWTPRLLGIAPLLIFSATLFAQGGPARGISMVLVVLLLAALLLLFYTVASILSSTNPQVRNPLLRAGCDGLRRLLKEPPSRSVPTATPLVWVQSAFLWLLKGVIASPIPEQPAQRETAKQPTADQEGSTVLRRMAAFDQPAVQLREHVGELQQSFFSLAEVFLSACRWYAGYLLQLRIQVGIALICLLLFQTQQVKDVVLAMVLDGDPGHFMMASLLGVLLSLLLWHTSRQLTRLFPAIETRRKGEGPAISLERTGIFSHTFEMFLFWLSWVSLALFSVPVAREAYGSPGGGGNLHLYVLLVLGALMIFFWRLLDRPESTWIGPKQKSFRFWFYTLFILGLLLPWLFRSLAANALPRALGSVALLFWALSIFLVMASTIYRFSLVTNFPLFSLLLVAVYLININRINDNHAVRLLPHDELLPHDDRVMAMEKRKTTSPLMANRRLPALEEVFRRWVEERRDVLARGGYSPKPGKDSKPYPIYVVSAQGGGIYAAYHTAKALAVLSEEVPGFSDHLFAISGVSGGSVGASVFVNSLRTAGRSTQGEFKRGELNNRIDAYFDAHNDRLAMILSTMLFGDMVQRFYPFAVPAWDRSLGLELGFENHNPDQPPGPDTPQPIQLDHSFYIDQDPDLRPADRGRAPYLALNTTEVENGRRYILAPFRINSLYSDADFHEPWLKRPEQMMPLDLRYSTAAGMSARFPIVSPYGFFPETRARRFIDGGLYDNSGAVTASEIINELQFLARKNKWPVRIIPIAIMDQKAVNLNSSYADAENLALHRSLKLFGWSAIDAVLSTREARLQKSVDLLDSNSHTDKKRRILLRKDFRLAGDPTRIFSVPLGWKLSCQARAFINDQIQPYPEHAKSGKTPATGDGEEFRMIPCELNIKPVKREPVRSQLDNGSREASLSQPFWSLIEELRQDLQPPGPSNVVTSATPTVRAMPR